MEITLEQLQDMGVRNSTLRYYLWFKHFVEIGRLDLAAYFLGKCWRRHGGLPESWSTLRDELDAANRAQLKGTHDGTGDDDRGDGLGGIGLLDGHAGGEDQSEAPH